MGNKFYDERMKELRKHFGTQGLQVEQGRNFPKLTTEKSQDKHYARHIQGLKDKFKIEGLQLEGQANAPKDKTLADLVNESERDEMKNLNLAVGSTTYQGNRLSIFYLKSKN